MNVSHTIIVLILVWLGTSATLYFLRSFIHKLLVGFNSHLPQDKNVSNVSELEVLDYTPLPGEYSPIALTDCETELTSACAETSEVVTNLVEHTSAAGEHLVNGLLESF